MYIYIINTFCITKFTENVRNVFTHIHFSVEHSNERMREESTYMFFLKYLDESEEENGMSILVISYCT